ncbi:MAG: hypothetical protein U0Q18_36985 [Bryobacteraceae bacterium]
MLRMHLEEDNSVVSRLQCDFCHLQLEGAYFCGKCAREAARHKGWQTEEWHGRPFHICPTCKQKLPLFPREAR